MGGGWICYYTTGRYQFHRIRPLGISPKIGRMMHSLDLWTKSSFSFSSLSSPRYHTCYSYLKSLAWCKSQTTTMFSSLGALSTFGSTCISVRSQHDDANINDHLNPKNHQQQQHRHSFYHFSISSNHNCIGTTVTGRRMYHSSTTNHKTISSSSSPSGSMDDVLQHHQEDGGEEELLEATVIRESSHSVKITNQKYGVLQLQEQQRKQYEKDLEKAMRYHERLVLTTTAAAATSTNTTSSDTSSGSDETGSLLILQSLRSLIQCYENLESWDQALVIEEELYDQLLKQPAQSVVSSSSSSSSRPNKEEEIILCLYRQGNLHMRLEDTFMAQRLYQDGLDLLTQEESQGERGRTVLEKKERKSILRGKITMAMAGPAFHTGRPEQAMAYLALAEECLRQAQQELPNEGDRTGICDDVVDTLIKCITKQGFVHRAMELYSEALECYQRALEVLEQSHRDEGDTVTTTTDKTQRLGEAVGDTKPSSSSSSSTSSRRNEYEQRRLGLMLDIADMHGAMDQNDKALQLYQEVLSLQDTLRGEHDEQVVLEGIVLHSIGKIHALQPEHRKQAIEELCTALRIKEKWFGEFHKETGKTLSALGAVYGVIGEKAEALKCFQQALLIARSHHAEDDPEVLLALRNIAVLKGENVAKW